MATTTVRTCSASTTSSTRIRTDTELVPERVRPRIPNPRKPAPQGRLTGLRLGVDLVERAERRMPCRRRVAIPHAETGRHPGAEGGVQLGGDVGEEQDLGRRPAQRGGDSAIARLVTLRPGRRVEVTADEAGQ